MSCCDVLGDGSLCRGPLDLALLIDSSGSLQERGDYFPMMKDFVSRLVQYFDVPNVRIGIILFSHMAVTHVRFSDNLSTGQLLGAIDNMPFMGSTTGFADALYTAQNELYQPNLGDRLDVPDVVLLVTDGEANHNAHQTFPAASAVRSHARIITVGVDKLINEEELRTISGDPRNTVILQTFNDLLLNTRSIAELVCGESFGSVTTPAPTTGRAVCSDLIFNFVIS